MSIQCKYNMLDTIPYNFFFALRADEKGVFICIYRIKERGKLGGERAVLQILPTQRYAARAELVYNTFFSALRADGKSIVRCLYNVNIIC